jgi:hypothetical protein
MQNQDLIRKINEIKDQIKRQQQEQEDADRQQHQL